MIAIRTPIDIEEARLPQHLEMAARKHLCHIQGNCSNYNPEDDGYLAVVTPNDTDLTLGQHLGQRWRDSMFEGVVFDPGSGCFVSVVLHNNQYAITILVPDEPWLDPAIRLRLVDELDNRQPHPPYLLG